MVRNRGQLLLIGAILIGMTIVGTVVMLNSMQHADATGSQSEYRLLDDAERTEEMVVRDMERLVEQVDADTPIKYEEAVVQNVSTYNNYTRNMSATRGNTVVNVSVNDTESDGTRIHQAPAGSTDDNFQRTDNGGPGNANDWTVAEDVEKVAGFRLNTTKIDGSGASSNPFRIKITNDSGDTWQMRIYSSGSGGAVEVKPTGSSWPATPDCTSSDEEINISLVDGTATETSSDCEFPSFRDDISPPYDIEFERGNKAHGTYTLFVSGTPTGNVDSADTQPYVVNPAIDYQYRTTELEYNRTVLIETGDSS